MSSNDWFDMSQIAIRVMIDGQPSANPPIVCTACGDTLTTLADYDTVAALMTLGREHFANTRHVGGPVIGTGGDVIGWAHIEAEGAET